MQDAEDIDTGVDTRTKEEMLADQMKGLKSTGKFIGETAVESIPGVSQAIGVKRTSDALEENDYVGAGIEGTALAASVVPGIGPAVAKGLRKFNKTRKAYKLFVKGEDGELYPLFVDANKPVKQNEFLEANFPDVTFKGKRKEGSKESFYVPTKGAKRSKGEKAKGTGDSIIIPDEATRQKLIDEGFITEKTRRTKEAPFGKVTAVAARPGWHASQAPVATHLGPQDLKVSKKEAEKLIAAGVTPEAIKRRGNQFYVKRRAEDQVFAEVDMADDVDYQSMLAKEGRSDINDRVPKGGSYKYSDGQADSDQWVVGGDMKVNRVLSREETRAIQKEMGVVDLPYRDEVETILDKKFAKGGVVMDDYLVAKMMDENDSRQKFAEGGMPKQMEMFEDGGLKDEGGTVDPVSGNDVPPGSTQEEVRDDIPAQLSEGEFVFPADVVRYIGLGNLMKIRQEAKMGLKMMDEMGQMGNSEEATMPDDLPFDINDLDMEDEDEYNNEVREMQVGGFVQPTQQQQQMGISGYQQAAAPTTGVSAVPQQAASQQYVQPVQPQQAAVPTMQAYKPSEVPTFQQTIGDDAFGTYDELRQYKNEAGNILNIPFRNGQPISPIPEGYTFVDPEATETEEVTTTPTTPQTTSVREEPGGDEPPGDTQYSTTDVTGIGYDRSKLTDSMKDIISEYGAGFGTLMETFGKASIPGAIASAFDKDPRVATNSVTSGSLGGVFDAFRGVTDRSGGRFQNQKSYENTTELHNLPAWQQDRLATVAGTTMKEMESFFKDEKGKGISNDKASKNMTNALASRFGLTQNQINEIANKGGNFNQTTKLARALSEKIAAENLAKERAAENKREQERAALDAATAAKREQDRIDTGGQGPGNVQTGGDEGGFTDTGPGGTGQDVGVDESTGFSTGYSDDGYNQGGLASKPKPKAKKKMKQGGLASKK